jgi:hypothetical protein
LASVRWLPRGVLTLRLPVAERVKPRKVSITSRDEDHKEINA